MSEPKEDWIKKLIKKLRNAGFKAKYYKNLDECFEDIDPVKQAEQIIKDQKEE